MDEGRFLEISGIIANLEIKEELIDKTILLSTCNINNFTINHNTHIYSDLKLDSLDFVELILDIEELYENKQLEISDDDSEKLLVIGIMNAYISAFLSEINVSIEDILIYSDIYINEEIHRVSN